MVELLKQPQYVPMDVIDQVISIYAGTRGHLDDVGLGHVAEFEKAMLEYFRTNSDAMAVRAELESKRAFDDALREKLNEAIGAFKRGWKAAA